MNGSLPVAWQNRMFRGQRGFMEKHLGRDETLQLAVTCTDQRLAVMVPAVVIPVVYEAVLPFLGLPGGVWGLLALLGLVGLAAAVKLLRVDRHTTVFVTDRHLYLIGRSLGVDFSSTTFKERHPLGTVDARVVPGKLESRLLVNDHSTFLPIGFEGLGAAVVQAAAQGRLDVDAQRMAEMRLGVPRGVGFGIIAALLWVYVYYWIYKTLSEIKQHSGIGVGGILGLVIAFTLWVVTWFLIPHSVGRMYRADGREAPVSGWTGLWFFLPVVGWITWFVKVQGSLNTYWWSKALTSGAASR